LIIVLSPPILSHSFLFFTEIVSAFIALSVFVWIRDGRAGRAGGTRAAEAATLFQFRCEALLAGAATGYLLLVHARNVGLIAGLVLLALLRARRWRDRGMIVAFLAGAAVLLAVRTGVTYHFWGTLITTPHER